MLHFILRWWRQPNNCSTLWDCSWILRTSKKKSCLLCIIHIMGLLHSRYILIKKTQNFPFFLPMVCYCSTQFNICACAYIHSAINPPSFLQFLGHQLLWRGTMHFFLTSKYNYLKNLSNAFVGDEYIFRCTLVFDTKLFSIRYNNLFITRILKELEKFTSSGLDVLLLESWCGSTYYCWCCCGWC